MAQETVAYVGLGSNLGDCHSSIRNALSQLDKTSDVRVYRISSLREYPALGDTEQPDYLNGVVEVGTTLSANAFFCVLTGIEKELGRKRNGVWSARTIDLDLLVFGQETIHQPDLLVPHPQLLVRHFVLEPLAELAPDLTLPGMSLSVSEAKERLAGRSYVRSGARPQLIAIAGNIGVGKTTLSDRLAQRLAGQVLYEPYDSNPFLPEVYAGKQELALDSQLYFLANRAEQLALETLVPGQVYIADYVFDKELIYARKLLNEAQRELYERLYRPLVRQVVTPVVVLYLRATVACCLERIHQRGRPYEQGINESFLTSLDQAYECVFAQWQQCPVVRLNAPAFNSRCETALEDLVQQIQFYIDTNQTQGSLQKARNTHDCH